MEGESKNSFLPTDEDCGAGCSETCCATTDQGRNTGKNHKIFQAFNDVILKSKEVVSNESSFYPQVGKDYYLVPKAYKLITLSHLHLREMERVINWFLSERVVALPLPNQHAYMWELGAEMALSSFADLVESTFHRRKTSFVVSLDCSGAFNRKKFSSAKEALDAAG